MSFTSKFFVLPDPQFQNISICLIVIEQTDFVFKVSKNPILFQAEPKLALILKGKEETIKAEIMRSDSIFLFCQKIQCLISQLYSSKSSKISQPPDTFFRRVLDEIRGIGWNYISGIDPTLNFFEVSIYDSSKRCISIRFDLSSSFPSTPPTVTTNLPEQPPLDWDPQVSHLSDILETVKAIIPSYEPLWDQLQDLDSHAFVIEPREPSLSCVTRRFVLSPQVQMEIELLPRRPRHFPRIRFIGAEIQSRQMREKLDSNATKWRLDKTLRENLETLLEMQLPQRNSQGISDTDMDCAICYMERLGAELPEIICGNPQCAKHFHRSCLLDWLRSKPNSQQSFQVVFGKCPFCDADIQCSVSNSII